MIHKLVSGAIKLPHLCCLTISLIYGVAFLLERSGLQRPLRLADSRAVRLFREHFDRHVLVVAANDRVRKQLLEFLWGFGLVACRQHSCGRQVLGSHDSESLKERADHGNALQDTEGPRRRGESTGTPAHAAARGRRGRKNTTRDVEPKWLTFQECQRCMRMSVRVSGVQGSTPAGPRTQ